MSENRSTRLAVLIDGDNASPEIVEGLFDEIAKIGVASVRRIYGDFSGLGLKSWSEKLPGHAIVPHQTFAHVKRKNATDIALVIDAMDLLYSGRIDGFCLVSSDSDFTRLATRIREHGVDVYGVGEQKTPESFRNACQRFIFAENLMPESSKRGTNTDSKPLKPLDHAVRLLRKAVDLLDDDDGWVNLSGVGNQLGKLFPDFDPRTYGYKKLIELVKNTRAFDVERTKDKGIKIRPKKSRKKNS